MVSERLLDHFQSPRNQGEMPEANAWAEDENPVCGDRLRLWLRIEGERIAQVSWLAQGCAPALAAASAMSCLVKGMTIEQASSLNRRAVEEELGGLPARKGHAAILAISALHRAIDSYR